MKVLVRYTVRAPEIARQFRMRSNTPQARADAIAALVKLLKDVALDDKVTLLGDNQNSVYGVFLVACNRTVADQLRLNKYITLTEVMP